MLFNRGALRVRTGDPEGATADLAAALDLGRPRRAEALASRAAAR